MSSHIGCRPVYLVRSGHCDDVDDMNADLQRRRRKGPCVTRRTSGPEGYKTSPAPLDSPEKGVALPPPLSARIPAAQTCNSRLSEAGHKFGLRLRQFMLDQHETVHRGVLAVPFTSTTPRAVETASYLPCPPAHHQQWSALNILDTGICHGLCVETIRDEMPTEVELWKKDPFLYRFPGGESTVDMNKRLGDVVLEIERVQEPAVVVSHLSTIQSLVAYFTGLDTHQIPFVSVPQHSVIVLTPNIYGASISWLNTLAYHMLMGIHLSFRLDT